jgi:hypothetical protein
MKIMNVSFAIDVKKIEHVQALTEFMRVLGEHEVHAVEVVEPAKPKKEPKAKSPVKVEVAEPTKPEPVEEEIEAVDLSPKTEEPQSSIDIETLRARVADLAKSSAENRQVIKAKLSELGAASVSTLEEGYYDQFYDFLTQM